MESIDTNTAMHISRELGSMDARITNIERDVGEIKASVAQLVQAQAAQKGGRAALFTVGGGGVSVGALLVAAAQWLGVGTPPAIAQPAPVQRTAPAQTTDEPVKTPPTGF